MRRTSHYPELILRRCWLNIAPTTLQRHHLEVVWGFRPLPDRHKRRTVLFAKTESGLG